MFRGLDVPKSEFSRLEHRYAWKGQSKPQVVGMHDVRKFVWNYELEQVRNKTETWDRDAQAKSRDRELRIMGLC